MMAFPLLKVATAVVSVALAAGLLARGHGLKGGRLVAIFLGCNAYWAILEFFAYRTSDPEVALLLYRASILGWLPLGVLCAHAALALSALQDHRFTKMLPACYASIAMLIPFGLFTDAVIRDVDSMGMGWRPDFGRGMVLAYGLLVAPLVGLLGSWQTMLRMADSRGQLWLARVVFFGFSGGLACGTLTAVLLPILGFPSAGISTSMIAGIGLVVAAALHRFGHALVSSEAFAREILDTLEDGVILVGSGGELRDANRAFLRMVGETGLGAHGRPITDWMSSFPTYAQSTEGSSLLQLQTRVGENVPIVLSAPVVCGGRGRLAGRAFVLRDRREIVSLQRRLVVSARLAAVGDLSKSISAAINEPVWGVRKEFDGLSRDWEAAAQIVDVVGLGEDCREAKEEGLELIGECVEGLDRIASIVHEVAGFSNVGEKEAFSSHAFDTIVKRAVRVAQVQAPEGVEIESRLDPDVQILCHEVEIERVVTNLLVNAIHSLDGNGPGQAHVVVAVAAQDGRALLHVEDDGCGIDAAALDRIFDPFFTTKPVGKGTGLGLAISYHIVKAHGGEIRVSSLQDRGTSVAVELPRAPLEAG